MNFRRKLTTHLISIIFPNIGFHGAKLFGVFQYRFSAHFLSSANFVLSNVAKVPIETGDITTAMSCEAENFLRFGCQVPPRDGKAS